MKKFMIPEYDMVEFEGNDVIATSCPTDQYIQCITTDEAEHSKSRSTF